MSPDADITDGGWTDQDGGSNLFAAIDEPAANDLDYIKSSNAPVNDTCEVSLSNPSGVPTQPFEVIYRYHKVGSGSIDLTVTLKQGATEIASWVHTDISTSIVEATQPLTSGEFGSITDFNDLRIEFVADSA